MALETKSIAITKAGYTALGINITSLAARSRRKETFSIVIVATGASAPLVGETDFATILGDKATDVQATAFDAYAKASNQNDTIEVIRE